MPPVGALPGRTERTIVTPALGSGGRPKCHQVVRHNAPWTRRTLPGDAHFGPSERLSTGMVAGRQRRRVVASGVSVLATYGQIALAADKSA